MTYKNSIVKHIIKDAKLDYVSSTLRYTVMLWGTTKGVFASSTLRYTVIFWGTTKGVLSQKIFYEVAKEEIKLILKKE